MFSLKPHTRTQEWQTRFQTAVWTFPKDTTAYDDAGWQKKLGDPCRSTAVPSRSQTGASQEPYCSSICWDMWMHHAHQRFWALGKEEEGWSVTVTNSRGLLQRLAMVTEANWLQRARRARHTDTTPVVFSTRNRDPGRLIISSGLHGCL